MNQINYILLKKILKKLFENNTKENVKKRWWFCINLIKFFASLKEEYSFCIFFNAKLIIKNTIKPHICEKISRLLEIIVIVKYINQKIYNHIKAS